AMKNRTYQQFWGALNMSLNLTDTTWAGADGAAPWLQRDAGPPITVVQRPEDLAALAPAWDRLATARSGGPMQHVAWAQAYAATSGGPERSLHVVVTGTPQPTAIAPLVKVQGRPARLELLGVGELYEPLDFVYATPDALAPLADALVQLGVP